MSLDPREDFDSPVHMSFDEPEDKPKKSAKKPKKPEPKKAPPVLSLPPADTSDPGDGVRQGITERNRAATNLRLAGSSYAEIAEMLEFRDARQARNAVEATLAATHSPDDWETLRMVESARAESLFRRSLAMASADYLVTPEGERVPNTEKLRWHQQAASDLMNHAVITGAKAPTRVEISPDEQKLEAIVNRLMIEAGQEEILEAEVLELEQVPAEPDEL